MSIDSVISNVFYIYYLLIIARIFLSFIPHNPYNSVIRFVYEVTDPWLNIFRRVIPPIGMIDISPIVAIFALGIVQRILLVFLHFIGL